MKMIFTWNFNLIDKNPPKKNIFGHILSILFFLQSYWTVRSWLKHNEELLKQQKVLIRAPCCLGFISTILGWVSIQDDADMGQC